MSVPLLSQHMNLSMEELPSVHQARQHMHEEEPLSAPQPIQQMNPNVEEPIQHLSQSVEESPSVPLPSLAYRDSLCGPI